MRADKASALAIGLMILACLSAVVAMLGILTDAPMHGRASPVYWLVLLPFAWWGASLAAYEPGAMRLFQPAMLFAPILALVALAVAWVQRRDVSPWVLAVGFTIIGVGLGWTFYRRSLLKRQGPAR